MPIGDAEGPLLSSLWLVSAAGHAVPKPNSDDLRLITDHSAGIHSLNSMIPQNDHPTYPLDNLHLLGEILISAQDNDNASNLVLFKSDVAEAYRLMPMHPFWQVKQAVQIQGVLHIDRCGVFGGRKSGDYSVSFHALVAWVAREIKDISDLSVYSDDFYGANDATGQVSGIISGISSRSPNPLQLASRFYHRPPTRVPKTLNMNLFCLTGVLRTCCIW